MYTCRLCRWQVDLDDVAIRFTAGDVICVKCYARETQTDKRMSAAMERDARRTVNEG